MTTLLECWPCIGVSEEMLNVQALLALERDQQLADKNYSYFDVLKCFKVR